MASKVDAEENDIGVDSEEVIAENGSTKLESENDHSKKNSVIT